MTKIVESKRSTAADARRYLRLQLARVHALDADALLQLLDGGLRLVDRLALGFKIGGELGLELLGAPI